MSAAAAHSTEEAREVGEAEAACAERRGLKGDVLSDKLQKLIEIHSFLEPIDIEKQARNAVTVIERNTSKTKKVPMMKRREGSSILKIRKKVVVHVKRRKVRRHKNKEEGCCSREKKGSLFSM